MLLLTFYHALEYLHQIVFTGTITRSARAVTIPLSFHTELVKKMTEGDWKVKIGGSGIQRMDINEVMDNIVLVIKMYSNDSCDLVAN